METPGFLPVFLIGVGWQSQLIRPLDNVILSQLNSVLANVGFDVFSATVYKPAAALTAATTVTPSIVLPQRSELHTLALFAVSMKFVP